MGHLHNNSTCRESLLLQEEREESKRRRAGVWRLEGRSAFVRERVGLCGGSGGAAAAAAVERAAAAAVLLGGGKDGREEGMFFLRCLQRRRRKATRGKSRQQFAFHPHPCLAIKVRAKRSLIFFLLQRDIGV